jgi:hypothetical protein
LIIKQQSDSLIYQGYFFRKGSFYLQHKHLEAEF